MVVPYNSERLAFANKQSTSAAASPFVVAIELAQIPALPGIINGCILVFLLSAANTDLYIASRTLYSLSVDGSAPKIFRHTNSHGVPVYALLLSATFGLLAFMNVSNDSKVVFKFFVNTITTFGLLCWITILISHIYFVRARVAQGISHTAVVYSAPFGIYGSYVSVPILCIITLTKNFDVFVSASKTGGTYGTFDYKNFITGYIGIPVYLILIFGYKFSFGSKAVAPETADLFSGRQDIDRDEANFVEAQVEERKRQDKQTSRLAYRFIAWLF
jgi:amino acid transporter